MPNPAAGVDQQTCLVDTTMLYARESGGVKRYLTAKRLWLHRHRPAVRHSLLLPAARDGDDGQGAWWVQAPAIPFGNGYRWPLDKAQWAERLIRRHPSLIEAEDPYTPGLAALEVGERLGVPVVGFCHTDLPALAGLMLGDWARATAQQAWAQVYGRFDLVLAPSRHMAGRLREAGVDQVQAVPLGVDVKVFTPERAQRAEVMKALGLTPDHKLLVFAGRPAREKHIDLLVRAVERLDRRFVLLLIGAGAAAPASDRVIALPYEPDARRLARLLASADAFVHANPDEALGIVVLEALACGTPVVGFASGGVAETVDATVGQLAWPVADKALAQAIDALFARDLETVGRAARRRAVDLHSWDRVFSGLVEIYRKLTGDGHFGEAEEISRSSSPPPKAARPI